MQLNDDDDCPMLVDAGLLSLPSPNTPAPSASTASTASTASATLTSTHSSSVAAASRVPVTIITGFLGAGKTTLIKRLLTDDHNRRIAVIVNDFGDTSENNNENLEAPLTVGENGQLLTDEWMELRNGCMCCSSKDAGVSAIEKLMEKKGRFDHVLLETAGLADPGPIAAMFWIDDDVESTLALDGILAVVDAQRCLQQLAQSPSTSTSAKGSSADVARPQAINEAVRQIALADRIILNKTDLVSPETLAQVLDAITIINSAATVIHAVRSVVPVDFVLRGTADFDPDMQAQRVAALESSLKHSLTHGGVHAPNADGTSASAFSGVSTVTLEFDASCPVLSLSNFHRWIQLLLWEQTLHVQFPQFATHVEEHDDQDCECTDHHHHGHGHGHSHSHEQHRAAPLVEQQPPMEILRSKGIIYQLDSPVQLTLQGVCETYDVQPGLPWRDSLTKATRLVIVGRYLNPTLLRQSFVAMCCTK
ncbi:COBW domain-containing protein [Capsaspora owczarzaki ATCC 30864]|uniref:COBW domain-containing protein, variant 1 n=1 Tax=Capsaspora owczarzaki (strain ATCC 30864) TaxID=595528 RepID=A0A0D2WXD6_CAPO3|nr:COBW domain-containing protein [Capsaspora owczarzaki ATCC 30864]KJE97418.1 COBW domain-containing protein, variant 1 [Capsaspora owczarzaki ATCC 30864]|eukprot:XP_004343140.2 COBW domain-containing protein [Capsaspora owczarzaki ATCC 30864]